MHLGLHRRFIDGITNGDLRKSIIRCRNLEKSTIRCYPMGFHTGIECPSRETNNILLLWYLCALTGWKRLVDSFIAAGAGFVEQISFEERDLSSLPAGRLFNDTAA